MNGRLRHFYLLRARGIKINKALRMAREALSLFLDSHEECTDFDGFTAQIVSMDDYHSAQESLESIDAALKGVE